MQLTRKRHPFELTAFGLFVFGLAVWNGLRLGSAIFYWKTLADYGTYPIYIGISGGFWLLTALFLAGGIWQGKIWAWSASMILSLSYSIWYWFDRLIMQIPHSNWPIAFITTVILLLIILLILASPRTRKYFS